MLDQKSPVGQDNHSNTGDGQGAGPELNKSPIISLPKGGGAIRSIGEKFATNPVTGSGSKSAPIATSLDRSGFGPQLLLSYDSGSSNGPLGLCWSLPYLSVTHKTDAAYQADADQNHLNRKSHSFYNQHVTAPFFQRQ